MTAMTDDSDPTDAHGAASSSAPGASSGSPSDTGPRDDWRARRLTRGDDRRISGVASGMAEYFGVDPTLVRIAFVVLLVVTFGTALLAYLILWLVLPTANGTSVVSGRGSETSTAMVIGGLFLVLLLAWTTTNIGTDAFANGLIIPVLLIGAGVVLLRTRGVDGRSGGEAVPGAPKASSLVDPSPGDRGQTPATVADDSSGNTDDRDLTPTGETGGGGTGGFGAAGPVQPEKPALPPKPPSVITPLVLSLMLMTAGIGLALHLTDTVDVQLSYVAGAWLGLISAGLLLSAFVGRAPGLIPMGLVASLALIAATVVDPIIDHGSGERDYVIQTLAELRPEYRLGVGDMRVDLSDLELGDQTRTIHIELAVGKLTVLLPPEPALELTMENDIGQIDFRDRSEGFGNPTPDNSGFGNRAQFVDDEGVGQLIVIVKNDIGDVQVTRVAG